MLNRSKTRPSLLMATLAFAFSAPLLGAAAARADQPDAIVYQFSYSNGYDPQSGLARAADGSLYGVTTQSDQGGTLFKFDATGKYSVLYDFKATYYNPTGTPTLGSDGSIYGTCDASTSGNSLAPGVVWKRSPSGTMSVLHQFTGGQDGGVPIGGLVIGKDGKLYGMSSGTSSGALATVFSINTDGTGYTVQYRFVSGVTTDCTLATGIGNDSQLYGFTKNGGAYNDGMLFSLTPGTSDGSGHLTVLHNFAGSGSSDGSAPSLGAVQFDAAGDIYGTTSLGGSNTSYGTLYELTPSGTYSVLHSFDNSANGTNPLGQVSIAPDGSLYGVCNTGGSGNGNGTLYHYVPSNGGFAMLHTFGDSASDGQSPYAAPTIDASGDIIGTASAGGDSDGDGVIYNFIGSTPVTVSALNLSNSTVTGAAATPSATGTVTLSLPAPIGGALVTLASANTSAVTVPASVTVPYNATSTTFNVATSSVSNPSSVSVIAYYNATGAYANLLVNPVATQPAAPTLSSITLGYSSVPGGTTFNSNKFSFTGNVTASTVVTLTSSNKAVVSVPTSETLAPGASTHNFTVTTKAVTQATTVTLTAASGNVTKSITLTVTP